jgi:hypothetical protein
MHVLVVVVVVVVVIVIVCISSHLICLTLLTLSSTVASLHSYIRRLLNHDDRDNQLDYTQASQDARTQTENILVCSAYIHCSKLHRSNAATRTSGRECGVRDEAGDAQRGGKR